MATIIIYFQWLHSRLLPISKNREAFGTFQEWLAECRDLIRATLRMDAETVDSMIKGAGEHIYRAKFDRGMTLSPDPS